MWENKMLTTMNHYFTKEVFMGKILPIFATKLQRTIAFFNSEELEICNKQISEIASQVLEVSFKRGIGAECPKKDSEPDCKILNEETKKMDAWELKCTSGENWRGGEYSKRPGYYVLMAYNIAEGTNIECFASRLYLEESDWKKSGSKNYYATTFGKKELMTCMDEGKVEILHGEIERKGRCQIKMVKKKIS
jgi:hypothetical protein